MITHSPTETGSDVRTLVAQARTGDDDAWRALFQAFQPLLHSIARAHSLSAAEAADASQCAWERLVVNIDRISDPTAVAAWLATTTRRECYAITRRRGREQPVDPHTQLHDLVAGAASVIEQDPLEQVSAHQEREHRRLSLHRALSQLPVNQARLVTLLFAEERLSYAEISARLRMPIGSIGPVRRRALDSLRNALALEIG